MDQTLGPSSAVSCAPQIVRSAVVSATMDNAIGELARVFDGTHMALVVLYVSPEADIHAIAHQASQTFGDIPVIGCTTAGEISCKGYTEGEIVAVGFPRENFGANVTLVDDLDSFDAVEIINSMIHARNDLMQQHPDWGHEFSFLVIDGLSIKEDALISELAAGLGPVPLFGGSAGDGMSFGKTFVMAQGRALQNAAVITQFRTNCPVKVFKTDHLIPSDARMVVTGADPVRRIVHEINAEPAAREYARILGKDPEQLDAFTFAAHPVVVRIGGQHHVRSIQRVTPEGDLIFFSAIDEGVVLTLAEPEHMVTHLEREIDALNNSRHGKPDAIIACDCILRRIEAQQKQLIHPISQLLARNNVLGFSTYGEQINSMHVNQTLTGVAIYPPETS